MKGISKLDIAKMPKRVRDQIEAQQLEEVQTPRNKLLSGILEESERPAGVKLIESIFNKHEISFETEYRFAKPRRFRFDFFSKQINLGVEYEGLGTKEGKSKMGGHQTLKGFSSNCEKYNLACKKGHRLLRYTALNYDQFENDLLELIKQAA